VLPANNNMRESSDLGHPVFFDACPIGVEVHGLNRLESRLVEPGATVVAWSSSAARVEAETGEEDDDAIDVRINFGPIAWAEFDAACASAAIWAEKAKARVLVRTHAGHVLSDHPSCVRAGGRWRSGEVPGGERLGILYDPGMMCSPTMVSGGMVMDHLTRLYEALEHPVLRGHGVVGGIVVGWPVLGKRGEVRVVGLEAGEPVSERVAGLVAGLSGIGHGATPLVLPGSTSESQRSMLVGAGVRFAGA
jgi:hypothetical protein